MTWTWRSCEQTECLDIVYVDSLTPVAADGYHYSDAAGEDVAASTAKVAALECDILFATHPGRVNLDRGLAAAGIDAFIEPDACRRCADGVIRQLERRLDAER